MQFFELENMHLKMTHKDFLCCFLENARTGFFLDISKKATIEIGETNLLFLIAGKRWR